MLFNVRVNLNFKVKVSELRNKTVGLYFSEQTDQKCCLFNPFLLETYNKLKQKGMEFEVVLVSLDESELQFVQGFREMPWLAVPFKVDSEKLKDCCGVETSPALVIIGPDGKILVGNAVDLIEEHGSRAYPFTPEKIAQLPELDKRRLEEHTLEHLLVCEDDDFVMDNRGSTVTSFRTKRTVFTNGQTQSMSLTCTFFLFGKLGTTVRPRWKMHSCFLLSSTCP